MGICSVQTARVKALLVCFSLKKKILETKKKPISIYCIVLSGERRPLLGSNTSRSESPVPSDNHYHSIDLSNELRQSFYSPVPSAESTNDNCWFKRIYWTLFRWILDSDNEESLGDTRRRGGSQSNLSQSMLGTPMSFVEDNENDYEKGLLFKTACFFSFLK